MATLFISDLHLEDSRPQATAILSGFLRSPAREADALYILGDLFEFWIGDDMVSETARQVGEDLAALRKHGVPCYFLHGNRDFLLGESYAAQAGLELLPETWIATLYGVPTLLLHGDTLCTGDVAYQAFRQQVRSKAFQQNFLGLPLPQRLEMARNARDASQQHTSNSAMDIMDANEQAVIAAFVGVIVVAFGFQVFLAEPSASGIAHGLVPGFEAPVLLAYSGRNRSASIRIPYVQGGSPRGTRIEVRFPDSTANPYFAFAAMMMAGLDGIQNKIHPGDPFDKDLYDLEPEELHGVPTVCSSLEQALDALDADREYLKKGGVFSDDTLDAYIALKRQDVQYVNMTTHPAEFELYYSV